MRDLCKLPEETAWECRALWSLHITGKLGTTTSQIEHTLVPLGTWSRQSCFDGHAKTFQRSASHFECETMSKAKSLRSQTKRSKNCRSQEAAWSSEDSSLLEVQGLPVLFSPAQAH